MHSIYFRTVTADLYVVALGDPRRVPRRDAQSTASMERALTPSSRNSTWRN